MKNKKEQKERGEIEVKIDFLVKPKAGSTLDLSKSKNNSLSLRSLKDKSKDFKSSISDKLKSIHKKKPKFTGENQVNKSLNQKLCFIFKFALFNLNRFRNTFS